jgi:hypothetical protein
MLYFILYAFINHMYHYYNYFILILFPLFKLVFPRQRLCINTNNLLYLYNKQNKKVKIKDFDVHTY